MTAFIPTTRVTVLRGTGTDLWGDPTDTATAIATGVPAYVTAGSANGAPGGQQSGRPVDGQGGVLEAFTVRLRPRVDVLEQDRLVDERTTAVYQVTDVFNPSGPAGLADVRVSAVRVALQSQPVNG